MASSCRLWVLLVLVTMLPLAAEQMRQDLVFTLAEDDEPYPKRTCVW